MNSYNEPFRLNPRLRLCAEFVRQGSAVADIGTDHAYLPVWLCKMNIAKSALACDIGQEPLQNGKETIKRYNAGEQVKTRLCDGLSGVAPSEADDIVIAGMGGETIVHIINSWRYSNSFGKHFILQPMTKSELLIEYLCKNGYEILAQRCCFDKKIYTVILAEYSGEVKDYPEEFYYLGKLSPCSCAEDKKYIEKEIRNLENKAKGNPNYLQTAQKLRAVCEGAMQ